MQCPSCGKKLPRQVRYCPTCGAMVAPRRWATWPRLLIPLLLVGGGVWVVTVTMQPSTAPTPTLPQEAATYNDQGLASEATRKKAEVDAAYAWVEIATTRALYIYKGLQKIPVLQKSLDIAKQAGRTAMEEELRKSYNNLIKDIDDALNVYIASIKQLDMKEKDAIKRAMEKYQHDIINRGEPERVKILTRAIKNHLDQYAQRKRANQEQWRADLEKL